MEVLFVVKGTVGLILSDRRPQAPVRDALTFDGGEPHSWVNVSRTRSAEVIWVLVPAPWNGSA